MTVMSRRAANIKGVLNDEKLKIIKLNLYNKLSYVTFNII